MVSELRIDISPYLQTFQVDPVRGFLPSRDPLKDLGGGFEAWEEAVQVLPNWLEDHEAREKLLRLPEFPVRRLAPHQCERALLMLAILAHAYVHESEPSSPTLPSVIAKPLVAVAERLGRPPVLAHGSIVLQNWERIDSDGPIELGNLRPLLTFRDTHDEGWFYLLTVEVEATGAKGISEMTAMLRAAKEDQAELVEDTLTNLLQIIPCLTRLLTRMKEGCDPGVFYENIRPYLDSLIGLTYEGIADRPVRSYAGGSAAQSTLLQALEVGLGIPHEEGRSAAFLREMRKYMPPAHRSFLNSLERMAPAFVEICEADSGLQGLRKACSMELQHFRNGHMKLVSEYILAHSQHKGPGHHGTGGTDPMPFLRQLRNDNGKFGKGA